MVLFREGTHVAIDKERVLGFITLNGNWIEYLYVSPDAQGRVIGWSLTQPIFKTRPSMLALRDFQKNTKSRSFYERRGFTLVELKDGSENEEHIPEAIYRWCSPAV